ncbi:MAG: type II toxin-antitoxin system HicB family antitoxin [bacterium]
MKKKVIYPKPDFDGFTAGLLLDEDGDWLAYLLELPNVSAFADTPEEALRELETAWQGVKESYQKHCEPVPLAPANKNYSGQFNVRIDKRIHRALAMEAAQAGISLNALVAQKLALTTPIPES